MAAAVASLATVATEPGEDAFRKLFRFYRQSRRGTADLGAVIDFSTAHVARGPSPGVPKVQREECGARCPAPMASRWAARHGRLHNPGWRWGEPLPARPVRRAVAHPRSAAPIAPGRIFPPAAIFSPTPAASLPKVWKSLVLLLTVH